MNWRRVEYDERLSPKTNRILDIISYSIYFALVAGPVLLVLLRQ